MSVEHVITAGEYLGLCPKRGYIYSVFTGYSGRGLKQYSIVAVKNGAVAILLSYKGVL